MFTAKVRQLEDENICSDLYKIKQFNLLKCTLDKVAEFRTKFQLKSTNE